MRRTAVCFLVLILWISVVGADTGYFWHITDFHWDFSYWTDQLSCNGMNISQPGRFGNQWCDSPYELVQSTIQGIREIKDDVDFILWTGDSVPHVTAEHLSETKNKEIVRNITELMKSQFPASVPVYATFGNHDYYPKDQYPPHGNSVYNDTYELWKAWITHGVTPEQEQTFLKGGYYTIVSNHGLRIVAMNSNMYYTKDLQTQSIDDPADQFQWLDQVLTTAEMNNEKVIITGHVPPGYTTPRAVRWMSQKFNTKFVQIVQQHSSVIVAMHFGHEHHDCFRLFYDKAGHPVVSLFIAPSVTPWRYKLSTGEVEPPHNPGARLIAYDRVNGKQLDIYQYYLDLNLANHEGAAIWHLGYNATSLYGINDITAVSMGTLVNKMTSPTEKNFLSYVRWYNTNAGSQPYPCDTACYKAVKCGFRYLEEGSFKQCLAVSGSLLSCYVNIYVVFVTCSVAAMLKLLY